MGTISMLYLWYWEEEEHKNNSFGEESWFAHSKHVLKLFNFQCGMFSPVIYGDFWHTPCQRKITEVHKKQEDCFCKLSRIMQS